VDEPLPRTPSFRLDGRRALVTGAGRGIGRAAAAALAQAGAHVVLASRSPGDLEAVAARIEEAGGSAEPLVLDVRDVAATQAAIARQPAFHVFVNNAGMNRPQPFLEVTVDTYDAVTNLNVRGAFFAAQAVARGMVREGARGSIINLSSQMGHVGGVERSVYCSTKHAIEGLTKVMAAELAPHGIRINALAPTFIETPMTRPMLEDPAFERAVLGKILLGRVGTVEDLMGAVLYLASDASALVTGTSLLVDGGWTAL
jgi:NAD(P)-dependent dehydrogenase (short-subunit alcohol dehydrogenase family)